VPAVRKAVIPAAGLGTRQYPATSFVRKELFPLVDRDGFTKPVLQIAVEEALDSGVEQVCIVGRPGAQKDLLAHFKPISPELQDKFRDKEWAWSQSRRLEEIAERLSFVEQPRQEGLGHAVWCARKWVADEPFLVLLGDHVFISTGPARCAAQLLQAYRTGSLTAFAVSGEDDLSRYGVASGRLKEGSARELSIAGFKEKPDPETARQECTVAGFPPGQYLTHFGMHIFSPGILQVLDEMIRSERRERGEFQLTTAQHLLCRREPYSGLIMEGLRYDTGTPLGMLNAQMALALSGRLRDDYRRLWRENLLRFQS